MTMCKDVKYNKEHEPGGGDTRCHKHLLTLLQVVDACGEKIAESSCCDSVPDAVTAVPLMHADPKYALLIPSTSLQQDLGQFCIENCITLLEASDSSGKIWKTWWYEGMHKVFFSRFAVFSICLPSESSLRLKRSDTLCWSGQPMHLVVWAVALHTTRRTWKSWWMWRWSTAHRLSSTSLWVSDRWQMSFVLPVYRADKLDFGVFC